MYSTCTLRLRARSLGIGDVRYVCRWDVGEGGVRSVLLGILGLESVRAMGRISSTTMSLAELLLGFHIRRKEAEDRG